MATSEMPPVPTWDAVLNTVEKDVLRTEAMLLLAVADLTNPGEAGIASLARTLADPAWAEVPPLDEMPAVPSGLVDRVQVLRERIERVRNDLDLAMQANRRQLSETTSVRPVVPETRSRFIDTVA